MPQKAFLLIAVLIFSTSSLFAQVVGIGDQTASATVTIGIKPALSIAAAGTVDFGSVLSSESGNKIVDPGSGALFTVSGHQTGSVIVDFPAALVLTGPGALSFVPDVQATSGNTYVGNSSVTSGTRENMTLGNLYLWLGWSIDVTTATEGDYTGSFAITVAY